jgi:mono/diheme cytochrome c family protein
MNRHLLLIGILFSALTTALAQEKTLKASIENGQQIYLGNCMSCHMENGEGVEGAFPPLIKNEFVNGDVKRLAGIILKGQTGEITVNGKSYNMEMPAQAHLSDEEVADVANYIRNTWGNECKKAVTVSEVAKIRE